MAKRKSTSVSYDREDYEAHDAMHTLMRAEEIRKDGALMKRVAKKAKTHAGEMRQKAQAAESLARRGLISDKQMSKMKGNKGQGGDVKDLDKKTPIATGNEGDEPSRTNQGVTYR